MPTSKTKQLAKKLGLVKRGKDLTNRNNSNKRRRAQNFSYIIVLDFESTCWKDKKGLQEIIEFPCVLLDVGCCKIVSEFQQYVQPQEQPVLSSFCTELTGITQNQVDNGVPLPTCLMLFNQWLKKLEQEKDILLLEPNQEYSPYEKESKNLCALATWTDWDLQVCLNCECQRKQIKKPTFFNQWIDLRATYKNFYERKPTGLKGSLEDLGIRFNGREHCGLDDARNTAALCARLVQDGCQLKITKSIHRPKVTSDIQRPLYNNRTDTPDNKKLTTDAKDQKEIVSIPSKSLSRLSPEIRTGHDISEDTKLTSANEVECDDLEKEDSFNIPKEAWLNIDLNNVSQTNTDSHNDATTTSRPAGILHPVTLLPSMNDLTYTPSTEQACRTGYNKSITESCRVAYNKTEAFTPITEPCSVVINKIRSITPNTEQSYGTVLHHSLEMISPFQEPGLQKTSTPLLKENTMSSIKCTSDINSSSSLFKTPNSREWMKLKTSMNKTNTCDKITPPLCKCGKRTRLKSVSTPGPNEGRGFFSCTKSRHSGCGYFLWESSLIQKYCDYTPEILTSEYGTE